MNPQVTDYIQKAPEDQQQIMDALRHLIHKTISGVTEEFKWSRPVFRKTTDFAYLKTAKNYVTFGFFHFDKLHDPQNRLEGTGKDMRHVKIKSLQDIDNNLFIGWLESSVE